MFRPKFRSLHYVKMKLQFIKENPTKCNNISKFIIPGLYEAQHVSGNTHHQELKTALAASGFAYVKGCCTLWLLECNSYLFRHEKPS